MKFFVIFFAMIFLTAGCELFDGKIPGAIKDVVEEPVEEPVVHPSAFGLKAPSVIPLNHRFVVTICGGPFKHNVKFMIDDFEAGTFAHARKSDCLEVLYPGMNKSGYRTLSAVYPETNDVLSTEIYVDDYKAVETPE